MERTLATTGCAADRPAIDGRPIVRGRIAAQPFAILVKVVDGRVRYLQFLEGSYATAASFRKAA